MQYNTSKYYPGAWILLLVAAVVLLLPWLGLTDFNSKGEPREAIVAVSILHSGNWILPVSSGGDIPFKPPFMAWLIAGFSWLFNGGNVTEYISRLPSALAGIALALASYSWASRQRGQRFGLLMGLVVLTSVEVFRAAEACRNDMILTACMVGAMYIFYDLHENLKSRYRSWRWLAAIMLLSCAVLTKGPVGALLPCFVIGVFYVFRGAPFFPTFFRMIGIALAAMIIPAVWYYAAYLQGGQRFLDLVYEENIQRLTGTMSYSSHVKPVWYNFVTLAAGMLPWTLLPLVAVFAIGKWRRAALRPAGMFALTAFILIVGFYCIPASKRSVYLLPAYPCIAYWIASILDGEEAFKPVRAFGWVIAVLGVLAPGAFIALQFVTVNGLDFVFDPIPWWAYILLIIPITLSVYWMIRHGNTPVRVCFIVWSLLLAYSAVVMPSVLNPRSDRKVVPYLESFSVRSSGLEKVKILTLEHEPGYRLFTINYYFDDAIRPVRSINAAANYPSGTLMLVSEHADTTGIHKYFRYENLLARSCDHREKVGLAIRK